MSVIICCRMNGRKEPTKKIKLNLGSKEPMLSRQILQQAATKLNYTGEVDASVARLYCSPHGDVFEDDADLIEKDDLIYVAFDGEDWVDLDNKRPRVAAPQSTLQASRPTRILVAVCNPRQEPLPSALLEMEDILEAWRSFGGDGTDALGQVIICGQNIQSPLTLKTLQHDLEHYQPDILHFIVHMGAKPNESGVTDMVMMDEDGRAVAIDSQIISGLLGSTRAHEYLKVVVLNGCDSGGAGLSFCRFDVHCICWDSLVEDKSASLFSRQLHKVWAQHVANDGIVSALVPAYQSAWTQVRTTMKASSIGYPGIMGTISKYAFADPARGVHTQEGSLCCGTVLHLRPHMPADHFHRVNISQSRAEDTPQSFPAPRTRYIEHSNEATKTYAKTPMNHARKILLRERYTFQLTSATGHVVTIQGQSGAGTTALVVELVHDPCVQGVYDAVFWVDARLGTDEERMQALAKAVSGSGSADLKAALEQKRCLIVVDGVTKSSQVKSVLDATSNALQTLLVTTRSLAVAQDFEESLLHQSVHVRDAAPLPNIVRLLPMVIKDAQKLLQVLLPNATWQVQVQEHGDELLSACEFLPRGIVEMAEQVRAGRFTVEQAATYVHEMGGIKKLFSSTLTRSWECDWDTIHLVKMIGSGYTGIVHEARCTELPTVDLAAKVMKPDASDSAQYTKFIKMLRLEVQALAMINHPNVVRMFGVSINEPSKGVCLLMEHMPKGSLRSVLDHNSSRLQVLSDRSIQFKLTRGIVRAMSFLHSRHPRAILHHDLKSANVLIEEGWNSKLCDFGMVTGIGTTTLTVTTTSGKNRPGTFLYAAPEALSADETFEYSTACEVWAFALIAWEVITGQQPFSHLSTLSLPALTNYVNDTHQGRPEEPDSTQLRGRDFLWHNVQKAWAQDPHARPTFLQLSSEFDAHANLYDVGSRDWSLVKQCVVRVGVYSLTEQKLLDVGSGTIVSATGHVLTAAHVLIDAQSKKPKQGLPPPSTSNVLYPEGNPDVVVLIGMYEGDSSSSRWAYWANVKTPYSVLSETFPGSAPLMPFVGHALLLDLAILEICGNVSVTPDIFMHTVTPGVTLPDTYVLNTPLVRTPQSFTSFLEIGNATTVATGEPLPCLGWPTPNGQTTIYVADDHSLLSKENGYFKSQAFMHSAMSGGPMLDWMKQIVAVNSLSYPDPAYGASGTGTLVEPASYAGWGRSIEYLRHEHWGPP